MNNYLVDVFKDTRYQSINGPYKLTTNEMVQNTTVYFSEDLEKFVPDRQDSQEVYFLNNTGTLEAASRYISSLSKIAVLNFADGLCPGGLVNVGAKTQEENLCRCSNLYESLISKNAVPYYNTNRNIQAFDPDRYTNTLIYSPDVTMFKDDVMYNNIRPYTVDVITCAAPSCYIKDDEALDLYKHRIACIMRSAAKHSADILILGAWGCGAFGQDPILMGKAFGEMCSSAKWFTKVVFAVRGNNSYKPLLKGFKSSYRGVVHE